jgi:hypothetical protein
MNNIPKYDILYFIMLSHPSSKQNATGLKRQDITKKATTLQIIPNSANARENKPLKNKATINIPKVPSNGLNLRYFLYVILPL